MSGCAGSLPFETEDQLASQEIIGAQRSRKFLRLKFEVGLGCGRSPAVVRLALAPNTSIYNEPKLPTSRGRLVRSWTMSGHCVVQRRSACGNHSGEADHLSGIGA